MAKYVTKTFTFEGKRYYVRGKNEVEAEVKKAMKLRDLEEGKALLSRDMSLKKWADSFLFINISMGCEVDEDTGELIGVTPLAEDLTPYCLRHTFCTDLQKKGVDLRSAQYLMGHSDVTLTANIYTHADQTTILQAAKKMQPEKEVQHQVQHLKAL